LRTHLVGASRGGGDLVTTRLLDAATFGESIEGTASADDYTASLVSRSRSCSPPQYSTTRRYRQRDRDMDRIRGWQRERKRERERERESERRLTIDTRSGPTEHLTETLQVPGGLRVADRARRCCSRARRGLGVMMVFLGVLGLGSGVDERRDESGEDGVLHIEQSVKSVEVDEGMIRMVRERG